MARNLLKFIMHNRFFTVMLIILVVLTAALIAVQYQHYKDSKAQNIPQNSQAGTQTGGVKTPGNGGSNGMEGSNVPISIRLSEGQAEPLKFVPLPVATGEPLTEEQILQILARLPDPEQAPGDQSDFELAGELLPPPRTGQTITESFPPPPEDFQTEPVDTGPLKVLRFAPEGEVSIAPFLNVTFSQPMVAIDTLQGLSQSEVPVEIDPPLPGTWRWLGTRTINFQYDSTLIDRLPKATTYRVTVPAGVKSANGGVLAESVEWTFTTPPPKVTFSIPADEPQGREPLFFIHFDQRIDPEAVLETIRVTADGRDTAIRLATEIEIQAEEKKNRLLSNAVEGRWLAMKAVEPLPSDAEIIVNIGPGTPSAEGPLVTQEAQSYRFRTYAPLRIEDHGCSWGGNRCPPLTPFYIRFNNPINAEIYDDSMIRIEPELPGASVNIYGNTIDIQGQTKGQTTYTVIVSGNIQDLFGQKLGQDQRLTFRVGPADPMLQGPGNILVTVDPVAKKPVFSVYAINYPKLDLKIYAVQPQDWPAYLQYLRDWQRTDVPVAVPGRQVANKTINVESTADALNQVDIDLSEVMDGRFGHFIVIVSPPENLFQSDRSVYWQTVNAWVQVTQIGLDAFADHSEMIAWTTDLASGAPLPEVTISAGPSGWQTTTGSDGVVRFPIVNGTSYLVASRGADQALLPRSSYYWGDETWYTRQVNDSLYWYVFDDRQMYRPGEEVHVKGWLRRIGGKQDGDVGLVDGLNAVYYRVIDPQGNEIGSGRVETNSLNGFDFAFTLPETVNLGYAQIYLTPEGSFSGVDANGYNHNFQIQEFRRPEFEVVARNETSGPYFLGGHAIVAVEAKYYAGGALPNAEVTWQVTTSPSHYAPPNWPDFTFGTWTPWWWFDYRFDGIYGNDGSGMKVETYSAVTDAAGEHYLRLDFSVEGEPKPVSVFAESTVMDVNRQAWTGSTNLLVHPASLYIGLRSERYFVDRGTPLRIEYIVTDLDGNPVEDRPVEIRAARLEWKYRGGAWQEEEADTQVCQQGSGKEPGLCTFETPIGGTYQITATITDEQGRRNQSQITRWVSGAEIPPARKVEQEKVNLIPDKESYQPGDTAEILVQSPFSPAEGLLSVHRSGVLYTTRFKIEDGTATLRIPIEEAHIPNLHIQVDVNGASHRTDDQGNKLEDIAPRPAFATGSLNLRIPPLARALSLQATLAQGEIEPGSETRLDVTVFDSSGQPARDAELAVVVVDEAVLALSGYDLSDPLAVFYPDRWLDWASVYGRSSIVLIDPTSLRDQMTAGAADSNYSGLALQKSNRSLEMPAAEAAMAPPMPTATAQMMDSGAAAQASPIKVRTDFNPLAEFSPAVKTDDEGRASLTVKLPDNLTRYRVMVVAVEDGKRFGTTEANLTARLPLMVRPSAPRFLNFGDRFELPVVLQNQTGEAMQVDIILRASNLELTGSNGARVTVPANDRIEVRFPATTQMAGTARVQIAAVGLYSAGETVDAATVELPVYTPATTEAFATYGVVDEGAVAQPVASPEDVFPQFGGLEITTSSTALQALTDAVLYLVSYPYDCTEQIASRILGIAALRDVLTAFEAEGLPSPQELEASVRKDIDMLAGLQNSDGGFPYWRRGMESIPFNSIHVAHALQRAQAKGFEIPAEMQQHLIDHLRRIEDFYPYWYSKETRWTLSSYALYVRNLSGDRDPAKAQKLITEAGLENLSLDAVGWLWPVLQDAPDTNALLDAIRLLVGNRVVETAGAANFTNRYDDQNYLLLGSDRRTDAILLDALMIDNPQHDLIPKLVNGLLAHTTRGRWMNTQENVFVLLALDRYFNTYESQTPDFVARVWLGEGYAGSHEFRGRTTDRKQTNVPMAYLVETIPADGTRDLILSKEGPGRLYYRLGLRYAPTDLDLEPLDMGFVVQREYQAVDDSEDVWKDENGVWHIKAGARVRVKLTMVADNRRYHVALADPLPAGLEIINPALAVSGGLPPDPTSPDSRLWWWWGPWYQHQNMRDERAEAFTPLLWDGVYDYTYYARATTPGTFVVPPTKAEEMYSPEVFGRSGSDLVIVE